MKKTVLFFAVVLGMLFGCSGGDEPAPSAPSAPSSDKLSPIEKIRERGVLLVGVKVDSPRMSALNPLTNEFEGMEVDMARLLAKRIFGDEDRLRIKPVTPQNRIEKLNEEVIDLTIGTFTIQEWRKKLVHFSDPYFTEGLAFLIRKSDHMQRIEQLEGKKIGIAKGTAPTAPLPDMLNERHMNAEVIVYPDYPVIKGALLSHEVDAFCTVRAALFGYLDEELEIMEETFHPGSYGIAIKLGNQELVDYVNEFLRELQADGTLDRLKTQWRVYDST